MQVCAQKQGRDVSPSENLSPFTRTIPTGTETQNYYLDENKGLVEEKKNLTVCILPGQKRYLSPSLLPSHAT